jgi:hypothetical protein
MSTKDRFGCSCDAPHGNSPLWDGPGFSRRQFFRVAGSAMTGYYFSQMTRPLEVIAAGKVPTKATARNCVFIFLNGAPSHVDTFDLKEGAWLPKDFDPTGYGDLRFPRGLMPNLAEQIDKLAIVRSVQSWAAVHSLAQTWAQIARNPTAALGKIAPNIGAVVALEKERKDAKLPGFIAFNSNTPVGPGYLASRYAPFGLTPNQNGLSGGTHPDGQARFDTRVALLKSLDDGLRVSSPIGRDAEDMAGYYDQARGMMYNTQIDSVFKYTTDERWRYGQFPAGNNTNANDRYGVNAFGDACIVTRNILKANLGTSFIRIDLGGWDNHSNIYQANAGIYPRARSLDGGLAALLKDLSDAPGIAAGKTLLDETLIVAMGEFGRTVSGPTMGSLNNQSGRDHFLQQFVVFAGGGVKGGRAIGSTNATGAYTDDPGWERNRPVRAEDIAATIYSALGIDWTTIRYDDPFKRGFEYIPFAASNDSYGPVNAVF